MEVVFLTAARRYAEAEEKINSLYEQDLLNADELEYMAWLFRDQEPIGYGPMRWISAAIRKDSNQGRLSTKAWLKLRDGKADEALELANQALKLAKEDGEDTAMYQSLIEEIAAKAK